LPTGSRFQRIVFNLGTLDCRPISSLDASQNPQGLELLPLCVARGTFSVPDSLLPALLAGDWNLSVDANTYSPQGAILPVDSDGDGIPDKDDQCPGTVTGALVDSHGCSIEQLCPCDGPWRNHGEFVNCLKQTGNEFLRAGLVTAKELRRIVNQGAASDCGRARR
jgi:hypothetical protein